MIKPTKYVFAIFAIAATLMVSMGAALAVDAVAKSAVNVRTGPGVGYAKVDTLHAGEQVEVTECQSGWCFVQHNGPDGWVSGNYLQAGQAPNNNNNNNNSGPSINFGINFGTGGINVTIGNPAPPPPPPTPNVCFFNGGNYTGQTFCVNAGANNNQLTGYWNDRISSIQVQPGATVQVCRNWNYGGYCQTYNGSAAGLNGFLNNNISSFQTY